ncbi:MAG: MBL fold metallo-hydrolase, partial [Armatimonadota bacterium]
MAQRRKVFERVAKDVFLFRDTCNVYVLRDGADAILIDLGSGAVLEHLREIGVRRVAWVVHTHHHREQCQGDHLLQPRGIRLAVPAGEALFFSGVEACWKHPDRFSVVGAPIASRTSASEQLAASMTACASIAIGVATDTAAVAAITVAAVLTFAQNMVLV